MEYFNFDSIEEAQTFVDLVNEGETFNGVTVNYCEVEFIYNRISEEEFTIEGYKVIKDAVTEKYV